MVKDKSDDARKVIATNRKAHHKYEIVETMEAGLVLTGPEVKSLRAGGVSLQDGFARFENERAWLWNVNINTYPYGSLHVEQEPTRRRVLLLKKREILRWMGKTAIKGLTIIPLEIYFTKRGYAKIMLGLAKGKKTVDRREDHKKNTLNREMQRDFAGKFKIKG